MPNALDVLKMGITQYGHPYSGDYDSLNGNHAWSYWCLAYVESTHRNLGLSVTPMVNAVSAGRARDLQPGRAPLGAAIYFDERFYSPDGHVAIALGNGACLGTLTDGTGVGLRWWNETTNGSMGWAYETGVSAAVPPDPPMDNWYVQPANPYQVEGAREIGLGGGFLRTWRAIGAGVDAYSILGYALENEAERSVDGQRRTTQRFERGTLIYQPVEPYPYDVVVALASSVITDLPDGG